MLVCSLVVGCILGYSYWLVVWNPLILDPSDGVSGRFDLAALLGLPYLKCLFSGAVNMLPALRGLGAVEVDWGKWLLFYICKLPKKTDLAAAHFLLVPQVHTCWAA